MRQNAKQLEQESLQMLPKRKLQQTYNQKRASYIFYMKNKNFIIVKILRQNQKCVTLKSIEQLFQILVTNFWNE